MATSILDFYKADVPRGNSLKGKEEWDEVTAPDFTITATTGYRFFIKSIMMMTCNTADFGANEVTITSPITFAGVNSKVITFEEIDEMWTACAPGAIVRLGTYTKGAIIFDAPIQVPSDESFTISYTGTGLYDGSIWWGASGWYVANADLD